MVSEIHLRFSRTVFPTQSLNWTTKHTTFHFKARTDFVVWHIIINFDILCRYDIESLYYVDVLSNLIILYINLFIKMNFITVLHNLIQLCKQFSYYCIPVYTYEKFWIFLLLNRFTIFLYIFKDLLNVS